MTTQFMIAAPTSGSGKTTIARGLMALFRQKGLRVQPFKCGPDYIDTKFHQAVCGRPSVNLDTFMATPDHVRDLFQRYGAASDVCIVEGMMGLYDGYDRDRGSSAEVARVLALPVVLVVDARSAAYSMAPLLQGFVGFRPDVSIAGVIFNKVGSERHYSMLRQVCDDVHVRCFGYLPKHPLLEQSSRYLGLDFSQEAESHKLVALLEAHVDWQALARLTSHSSLLTHHFSLNTSHFSLNTSHFSLNTSPFSLNTSPFSLNTSPFSLNTSPSVLIARSAESFSFVYQETLDALPVKRFFNPETDVPSFDDIDLLYLPGGYPEKHLEALVGNEACRRAVSDFAEQGGRVVAECGGMMYLCRSIVTDQGRYPMCGVLPYDITARQADRHLSLGYRRFELEGREYRGHEFHYTQFLPAEGTSSSASLPSAAQVYNAKGEPVPTPVFRYKNVLASYTHLYLNEANIY